MVRPPQELTPLQKDVVMLHELALGNLVTADTIELPGGYIAQSHTTETGVTIRYCNNPSQYLLQIVGPISPKPNSRNTSQALVHWEKAAPPQGIVELRETTETDSVEDYPVVLPEVKKQLIDSLSKLLIKGFSLGQTDEKP